MDHLPIRVSRLSSWSHASEVYTTLSVMGRSFGWVNNQCPTSVQHLASELDSLFQQVNRYGHRVCLRRWLLYWSSQRRADAFLRRKYVDSPPHQSPLDSRTLPILACKVSLPPKSSRLNEHTSQYLPICLALLSPGACVGGTQGPKALKCVKC